MAEKEEDKDPYEMDILGRWVLKIPPAIEDIPYDMDMHLSYEYKKKMDSQFKLCYCGWW